ncbi:hypothetical protein TPENAI_20291 [Tenacibaculum litopenaei]|uniref:hypothetical protein n=1 Tax=Tenacibaculum litopenaei TaxID=396016 RepID=UPI003895ED52
MFTKELPKTTLQTNKLTHVICEEFSGIKAGIKSNNDIKNNKGLKTKAYKAEYLVGFRRGYT